MAGPTGVFSVMSRAEPEPDLDQTHRSFAPANYARLQTALARQRGTAKRGERTMKWKKEIQRDEGRGGRDDAMTHLDTAGEGGMCEA